MDASSDSPSRTDRCREEIKAIILAHLSVPRVRQLRTAYKESQLTIAELSQRENVPPVILWSLLTPLYEKTHVKHRLIKREMKVQELLEAGADKKEIAKALAVSEKEAEDYTVNCFAEHMFLTRPWYNNQAVMPGESESESESAWEEFVGGPLPPASRIGWTAGELREIDPDLLGRCPTCGQKVCLPCLACATREYLKTRRVPAAREVVDMEDGEERLPELMFR